jgi:outer membrane protein
MKNISIYLSLLSLIGVGVLFYLHFSSPKKNTRQAVTNVSDGKRDFKIAYFDIDSLQDKYEYFKDVSQELKSKEGSVTAQLNSLQDSYQKRLRELQERSATMTQAEGEAAQREYAQMQQKFQQKQMSLEQDLKKQQLDMMTSVRNKIENYLKDFNREKGYAFILSYEPGFMLYYRDSLYDITNEVIKGLNEEYKKEKK